MKVESWEELRGALSGVLAGMVLRNEVVENYDRGYYDAIRWVAENLLGYDEVEIDVMKQVKEIREEVAEHIIE